MPQLTFVGIVFSGTGKGKRFVQLPWVKRQIEENLGFSPYGGTLNLRLSKAETEKRRLLDVAEGVRVVPEQRFYPGKLFLAEIDAQRCAVVLPIVPNYPVDILEVIAPDCLRNKLGLADGSFVVTTVRF